MWLPLSLIVGATALCFCWCDDDDNLPFVLKGYCVWCALCLGVLVISHLGLLDRVPTRLLPLEKQYRLTHAGYYVNRNAGGFILSGRDDAEDAFAIRRMEKGDELRVRLIAGGVRGASPAWQLVHRAGGEQPVFVDGKCVNPSGYLENGASLIVQVTRRSAPYRIDIYRSDTSRLSTNLRLRFYVGDDAVYSSSNALKKDIDAFGLLASGWRKDPELAAFAKEVHIDSVLKNIILSGLSQRVSSTKLAVFVRHSLLSQKDVTITLGGRGLLEHSDRENQLRERVTYGFGRGSVAFAPMIPDRHDRLYLMQEPQESTSLPIASTAPFLITTTRDDVSSLPVFEVAGLPRGGRSFTYKAHYDVQSQAFDAQDGAVSQCAGPPEAWCNDRKKPREMIEVGDSRLGALVAVRRVPIPTMFLRLGWQAVGALALLLLFTLLSLSRIEKSDDLNFPSALSCLSILWTGMALLTGRLLLAARIGFLAVPGTSEAEVARKALLLAIFGYWAVTGLVILGMYCLWPRTSRGDGRSCAPSAPTSNRAVLPRASTTNSRIQRLTTWLWDSLRLYWLLAIAAALPLLAGPHHESIRISFFAFDLRLSILTHLLVIADLTWRSEDLWAKAASTGWCLAQHLLLRLVFPHLVIFGLMLGWVGDWGYIVYAPSLSLVPLLILWRRRRVASGLETLLALACVSIFLAIGLTLRQGAYRYFISKDYVLERLTCYSGRVGEALSDPRAVMTAEGLIDCSALDWQVRNAAANGAQRPAGYGQAQISRFGVPHTVAGCDAAYPVYLVSEHGFGAALTWLVLYLALFAYCAYAACCLPRGERPDNDLQHRGLPLYAIGGYFAFNGLYMASASLGQTPFTGLNMPFLGMTSAAELIQSCGLMLLALAIIWRGYPPGLRPHPGAVVQDLLLVSTGLAADGEAAEKGNGNAGPLIGFLAVGCAIIWLVFYSYRLYSMKNSAPLRGDFALLRRDQHMRLAKGYLPLGTSAPDERRVRLSCAASSDGTTCRLEPPGHPLDLPLLIGHYVDNFNQRTFLGQQDKSKGPLYLEPVSKADSLPKLAFDPDFYNAASPFGRREPRAVRLRGSTEPHVRPAGRPDLQYRPGMSNPPPQDCVAGIRFNPGSPGSHKGRFLLCGPEAGASAAQCSLSWQTKGGSVEYLLEVDNGSCWVDGIPIPKDHPRKLEDGALLGFSSKGDTSTWVFSAGGHQQEAASRGWRNGLQTQLFPHRTAEGRNLYPSARFLAGASVAAPAGPDHGEAAESAGSVELTLAPDLQSALQAATIGYVAGLRGSQWPPASISGTFIDAFSGEVLAQLSWRETDRSESTAPRHEAQDGGRDYQHARLNLNNHGIGSTFKPLLFSVVAAAFPDINWEKFLVLHGPDWSTEHGHTQLAGLPLGSPWKCLGRTGRADIGETLKDGEINSKKYLEFSVNYFQAVLGMMAVLQSPQHFYRMLKALPERDRHAVGPDITAIKNPYPNQDPPLLYSLDYSPTPGGSDLIPGTSFYFNGSTVEIARSDLQSSLLMTGLSTLFDTLFSSEIPPSSSVRTKFLGEGAIAGAGQDSAMPESVVFGDIKLLDELRNFFVGGGTCKFNNVAMAQAGARIFTGRRVEAHILRNTGIKDGDWDAMPKPLNDARWRKTYLLDPLCAATSAKLLQQERADCSGMGPWVFAAKTGTMNNPNTAREGGEDAWENEFLLFIYGRWRNGGFVEGQTVAGFVQLEDSKRTTGDVHRKGVFARQVVVPSLQGFLLSLPERGAKKQVLPPR